MNQLQPAIAAKVLIFAPALIHSVFRSQQVMLCNVAADE